MDHGGCICAATVHVRLFTMSRRRDCAGAKTWRQPFALSSRESAHFGDLPTLNSPPNGLQAIMTGDEHADQSKPVVQQHPMQQAIQTSSLPLTATQLFSPQMLPRCGKLPYQTPTWMIIRQSAYTKLTKSGYKSSWHDHTWRDGFRFCMRQHPMSLAAKMELPEHHG